MILVDTKPLPQLKLLTQLILLSCSLQLTRLGQPWARIHRIYQAAPDLSTSILFGPHKSQKETKR